MLKKTLAFALAALSLVSLATPTTAATSCRLSPSTSAYELGTFYGRVVDTTSNKQLFAKRAKEQTPSASVLKVLTGISALLQLPAGYTVATKVYRVAGSPDTIVLKGAGDPTLSRLLPPHYTTYPKPARLPRLAAAALAKLPVDFQIKRIIIDDSFFNGDEYNPYWKASDRTNGYVSPISSISVDAARVNPDLTDKKYSGTRVSDPTMQAANFFKSALGARARGAVIERTKFQYQNLVELASVQSSTIEAWVDHGMKHSDNTEVEYIARHVSKSLGLGTNYTDIQPAIVRSMARLGVLTNGLVMHDAAGLAQEDRVTPQLITDALIAADRPTSQVPNFASYLATTTSAGTLSTRFKGVNKLPAGVVQAKTGYIPGLYSLAGYVTAKDGHRLVFAFFARGGGVGAGTRTKLDSLVVKAYTCGARLTN